MKEQKWVSEMIGCNHCKNKHICKYKATMDDSMVTLPNTDTHTFIKYSAKCEYYTATGTEDLGVHIK